MVILHIYEARAIFLLFYDDQDTESEYQGIEMSTSQLIFTHNNIPKALWDNDIHTLQNGRNALWKFFIFMELDPYIYYFMMIKTLNLSNVTYNWAHLNLYPPIKIYQRLFGRMISIIYKTGENCYGNSSYLWSQRHFSTI